MNPARAVVASLLAFLVGAVGMHVVAEQRPQWACGAEDEVVVIDSTCAHVDRLTHP